ncbi:MAG: hypothetical protein OEO77_08520 [Acidimicrobiia bacterium]|nr:hypothetical protein [Acidimicrobiia bacterium]
MERNQDAADIDPAVMERIGRILSEIDASDVVRVDPPADLWDNIVASIAAEEEAQRHAAPKEPPNRERTTGTVVEYWIDGDDFLTDIGQDWSEFARDNGAPGLATSAPDRSLWTYFDRDEVRELWQLLVDRVRATRKQVRVPLRCDAAHARRWFEMTVTPETNGRVHFRCVLVFEESREPVPLLDIRSQRNLDAEPILVCSWCGRGQSGSRWLAIEDLVHVDRLLEQTSMPPISYGICDPCRDDMSAELLLSAGVVDDD